MEGERNPLDATGVTSSFKRRRGKEATMLARRICTALTASTFLLLVVGPLATGATVSAAGPPTGTIDTSFPGPPTTFYTANVTDPDGDALSFVWTAEVNCGSWEVVTRQGAPANNGVDWWHGEPGEGPLANKSGHPCSHAGGTNSSNHVSTVTVRVSDGTGNEITCTATGPFTDSKPCQTSSSSPSPSPSASNASADLCVKLDGKDGTFDEAIDDQCESLKAGEHKVFAGEGAHYEATISNKGPNDAEDVVVDFRYSEGMKTPTDVEATADGECEVFKQSASVTCKWGSVPAGSVREASLVLRELTLGAQQMSAKVTSGSPIDPDSSNNDATIATEVIPSADLRVETSAINVDREKATHIVSVTNLGPSTATRLRLEVTVELFGRRGAKASASIDSNVTNVWSCAPFKRPLVPGENETVCTLGSLDPPAAAMTQP